MLAHDDQWVRQPGEERVACTIIDVDSDRVRRVDTGVADVVAGAVFEIDDRIEVSIGGKAALGFFKMEGALCSVGEGRVCGA